MLKFSAWFFSYSCKSRKDIKRIFNWRFHPSTQFEFPVDENGDTFQDSDIKRFSRDSEGLWWICYIVNWIRDTLAQFTGENRVTTPTATESTLPWKRGEDDKEDSGAIQQTEFPAWATNKDYLAYNSPSATFLGNLSSLSIHHHSFLIWYKWILNQKSFKELEACN